MIATWHRLFCFSVLQNRLDDLCQGSLGQAPARLRELEGWWSSLMRAITRLPVMMDDVCNIADLNAAGCAANCAAWADAVASRLQAHVQHERCSAMQS